MSAKAIREYDGKLLLAYHLLRAPVSNDSPSLFTPAATKLAHININTSLLNGPAGTFESALKQQLDNLEQSHPWLLTDKLVAKPDQLIKRRGKHGLLTLNKDWSEARQWIEERAGKEIKVKQMKWNIIIDNHTFSSKIDWKNDRCLEDLLGRTICSAPGKHRILHLY